MLTGWLKYYHISIGHSNIDTVRLKVHEQFVTDLFIKQSIVINPTTVEFSEQLTKMCCI